MNPKEMVGNCGLDSSGS